MGGTALSSTRETAEHYRDAFWHPGRMATALRTARMRRPCDTSLGTPGRRGSRIGHPGVSQARWAVGRRAHPTASPSDVGQGPQCPLVMYLATQGPGEPERWHGPAPPRLSGGAGGALAGTGTCLHRALSAHALGRT